MPIFGRSGQEAVQVKDAIDEMNNDFMQQWKEYPADVSSMMTWLLKRCGNTSNNKEDNTADGVMIGLK